MNAEEALRAENNLLKAELLAAGRRNAQRWIVGLLIVLVIVATGVSVSLLQVQIVHNQNQITQNQTSSKSRGVKILGNQTQIDRRLSHIEAKLGIKN